mmetsp:Transcript_30817/g.55949  ORF Transcript_30817/g.55949 Transcript_30817/m.55949 type:complete len:114 (+) Transcript_30817:69-410(+)
MPLDWHIIGVQSIKSEEKWRKIWKEQEKQSRMEQQRLAELEAAEAVTQGSAVPQSEHSTAASAMIERKSSSGVLSRAGSLALETSENEHASPSRMRKTVSAASLGKPVKTWMP